MCGYIRSRFLDIFWEPSVYKLSLQGLPWRQLGVFFFNLAQFLRRFHFDRSEYWNIPLWFAPKDSLFCFTKLCYFKKETKIRGQNLLGRSGYLAPFPITACPTLVKFFSFYLGATKCVFVGGDEKMGPRKWWQEASGFLHGSHDEKHKLIFAAKICNPLVGFARESESLASLTSVFVKHERWWWWWWYPKSWPFRG